jgi:HEPN domain-containing protein
MGEKKIKMCQKKDKSIKKVLEEIEDKAIESRYTNMYDWQRRELSKEDLFEYAEEMRKCLDKIFDLAIDERLK